MARGSQSEVSLMERSDVVKVQLVGVNGYCCLSTGPHGIIRVADAC